MFKFIIIFSFFLVLSTLASAEEVDILTKEAHPSNYALLFEYQDILVYFDFNLVSDVWNDSDNTGKTVYEGVDGESVFIIRTFDDENGLKKEEVESKVKLRNGNYLNLSHGPNPSYEESNDLIEKGFVYLVNTKLYAYEMANSQ